MGRGGLELAQTLLRVALAWHNAGSSTPNGPRVNDPFGTCNAQQTWSWVAEAAAVSEQHSCAAGGGQREQLICTMAVKMRGCCITVFTS